MMTMTDWGCEKMKHPEYDSPFVLNLSDITAQIAQNIDGRCWQAVQKAGIYVDRDKLLTALNQDSKRYREAYERGYETGYETRDEEIIRCKDCRRKGTHECPIYAGAIGGFVLPDDWYCANGEGTE